MRITGGAWRGRGLRTPKGGVRPTQDMVRQAVFNILMTRIEGARFLDLYAGTGAVGLEALSRGASEVCWVENDRRTVAVLRENVKGVGWEGPGEGDSASVREEPRKARKTRNEGRDVVAEDALRFLRRRAGRAAYDVIYADPPYVDERAGEQDPMAALLEAITDGDVLAGGGVFVYESAGGGRTRAVTPPEGWREVTDREYGRTRIRVFERNRP